MTPVKRCAILGTAPTWKATTWDDPTLEIWGLNDAYVLKLPRADRWYDLHPFDHFAFHRAGQKVMATDVPAGFFLRPEGHIEWLAQQSIPIYLQSAQPSVPRGIVFPRQQIVERFGQWFDSTPAWMVAHALLDGYTEIHINGIHLATEWEYQKQKPNMTFLCGLAKGMGVTIITPSGSPLLRPTHQYAFEADPAVPVVEAQRHYARVEQKRQVLAQQLKQTSKWRQPSTYHALSTQMAWLDAQLLDAKMGVDWQMTHKRAIWDD